MAETMEMPECPVCLQPYDGECTIPRVLACGHTACETCLLNLPHKFPDTVRCPACNVLVKYPPQGPSFLPKNIDLLRLIDQNPQKPHKNPKNYRPVPQVDFLPRSWSDEFYALWKQYILPQDAVLVEQRSAEGDTCFGCLSQSQSQRVSLVKVGSLLSSDNDDAVFKYSYVVRVIKCLSGMKMEERDELSFILRVASKESKICTILGLWADLEDGVLWLVCERLNRGLLESLDCLRNEDGLGNNGLFSFAMMGMEMCEALIGLNTQGLNLGCLGFSCFSFDDFGHVYVDLNDVLVIGRKAVKSVQDVSCGGTRIDDEGLGHFLSDLLKQNVFLSPEVLIELLKNAGIQVEADEFKYLIGYGSDVWSLACILLGLLIGTQFSEELVNYILCVSTRTSKESSLDFLGIYTGWVEKISLLWETKFGLKFVLLQRIICQCLNFDPESRPHPTDVWKSIRELIIKPEFDKMMKPDRAACLENKGHFLVLGQLCWLPKKILETQELLGAENGDGSDIDQAGESRDVRDLVEGLSKGNFKFRDMRGHLGCVTGLAVGGGYLFSSSFDKSVHVWSLQDFSHVHTFKGHEHRVMAVVFVDEDQSLCISGDSGGGIFVWSISFPFGQEPLKKWNEQKDWRYSGIHAMAVSGRYLYTGSGDKTIKAWSLSDSTLSCTMTGHKSVVSALAVCNGVLYSGSWDGTIRLWSLSDHNLLTVLGEASSGTVYSVLSLIAAEHTLVASYENGSIKVWRNDVFMKFIQTHKGSIFAICMEGKWLFTGGWDKTVSVQEITGDEFQVDAIPVGSIPCSSVITALLYWQGKLFVGYADRTVKVYYYGK